MSFLKKKNAAKDEITDVKPSAVSGAVISNTAGLPAHSQILDPNTAPTLWAGIDPEIEIVILATEDRNAFIATADPNFAKKSVYKILRTNIQRQVYDLVSCVTVTKDLIKKLRGFTSAKGYSDRIQVLKSEPLIRFRGWLSTALKMDATDLHLETHNSSGQVRVRAHGDMWHLEDAVSGRYRADQITETISSIFQNLTLGSSNSTSMWKHTSDSYTMLKYDLEGVPITMRFQSIAGHQGPKAVIRILAGADKPSLGLDAHGYADSHLLELRRAQQTTNGLVLFAGITGSGKTTSIRSFIETHPLNGTIVINTVEDPVELVIKGAHQKSVQRDFNDDEEEVRKKFNGAIAAMLRGDIDIGMLGELRDSVTGNAWLNIAETGHMAISTLHAHRLSGIFPRLTNETMGLSLDALTTPQTINVFAYQALLPSNCPVCALSTDEMLKLDGAIGSKTHNALLVAEKLQLDATRFRWRNPHGCEACNKRGTQGQTLVAELLSPDWKWLELMRARKTIEAFEYHRGRGVFDLKSDDMFCRSIVEHGLYKVMQGKIDITMLSRFEKLSQFADNYVRLKGSAT